MLGLLVSYVILSKKAGLLDMFEKYSLSLLVRMSITPFPTLLPLEKTKNKLGKSGKALTYGISVITAIRFSKSQTDLLFLSTTKYFILHITGVIQGRN